MMRRGRFNWPRLDLTCMCFTKFEETPDSRKHPGLIIFTRIRSVPELEDESSQSNWSYIREI